MVASSLCLERGRAHACTTRWTGSLGEDALWCGLQQCAIEGMVMRCNGDVPLLNGAIVRSMTAQRQALGLLGERIAARWLRRDGWSLVAHRFRTGHRDIDLIMRREGEVAIR